MENSNVGDKHVHGAVAGVVMLAAIFTTFTTYSYYQDDKLASVYEEEKASSEQVASVLVSLRLSKEADVATTTATTTKETTKKVELQ
jgi:hypothetical protein